jgi:hypothetical protein
VSSPGFLLCTNCGDRIGVYEPARLELTDGSIRVSFVLNIDPDPRHAENRLRRWHLGCLTPDAISGTSDSSWT